MARPYGYCNTCQAYVDLGNVELRDGTWGYRCQECRSTFTRSGKPAESK